LKCIFVSDLHGKKGHYNRLFKIISNELPDGVFFGGDLLPLKLKHYNNMEDFIENILLSKIESIKKKSDKQVRFFLIMGNDDPKIYESIFVDADRIGLINYVQESSVKFGNHYVSGYSFVPPTPFILKDWEKYDVSRFVDVGAISPEEGMRTVHIDNDKIKFSTIIDDLKKLSQISPPEKTIFLFHSPPYKSLLDRASLDGKKLDHAPFDVHIGSIAIKRFITEFQPFITLHGHVHESSRLTGSWKEKFGKTFSFSAAYEGSELAIIRFNTENLENASRELIE
jgi:Icc-related predicted phosphoesterase